MATVLNKYNTWRKTFNSFQAKPYYDEFSQNFHIFCFNKAANSHAQTGYLTEVIMPHDPRSEKAHRVYKGRSDWTVKSKNMKTDANRKRSD